MIETFPKRLNSTLVIFIFLFSVFLIGIPISPVFGACTCICEDNFTVPNMTDGPSCQTECQIRLCSNPIPPPAQRACDMDNARSTCDDVGVGTGAGITPPPSQYSLEGADPLNLQTGSGRDVVTLVSTVITYVLGFVGATVFIAFLYGGTLIIFSAGNPKRVGAGKNVLVYSVIGLAIIFFSYAILNLFFNVLKSGVI